MAEISSLVAISKEVKLSNTFVAYLLGVSRAAYSQWVQTGAPKGRAEQIKAVTEFLTMLRNAGYLPRKKADLLYLGLCYLEEKLHARGFRISETVSSES